MNSATRNNEDSSRDISLESWASEDAIDDIASFKTIEEVESVEVGFANGHTAMAGYKGCINVML